MIINVMLSIQLNVFMVLLLLSIAVHACFKLNKKEEAHRLFFTLTCLTIVILILEIFSVVLNSTEYIAFSALQKVVNTLGFTLTPLVPIIATLYVYKRTKKYKKIPVEKLFWLSVPLIINSILSLGSYHFNWLFIITDENLYIRGPLFIVSPLISYFYYTLHIMVLYNNHKNVSKEELIVISSLTLIPAVLSVFQLYYFIYLTIWNSVGIAVVLNYIFIMNEQAKRDPLTGLGNRMAYDEYLEIWSRRSNIVLSVVNIDLDGFKSINDIFGHQEGDKVLQFFARQLEVVFGEVGVAIRCGGDEFILFLNEKSRQRLETYIKELNDNIDAYNDSNEMAYSIQFSCGVAVFDDSYNNVYEFIRHSDKLMYEEKQKKACLHNVVESPVSD